MALIFMVQKGECRDFPDGPVVKMGVKMQEAGGGGGAGGEWGCWVRSLVGELEPACHS